MIIITESNFNSIKQNALQKYPEECCGFLFGKTESSETQLIKTVTDIQPVNNTSPENREKEYHIAPADYLKAEKYAAENNLDLLGIYHSHPDHPASPSEYDRMRALPVFSYLIISVSKKGIADLTSSLLNESNQFEYERMEITHG